MSPVPCHLAAVKTDRSLSWILPDDNRLFSVSRQNKLLRQKNPAVRSLSLAAELALCCALRSLDPGFQPPADYAYAPSGQPHMPGGPYISLSHSGQYALAAAAPCPIGADIEGPVTARLSLAAQCLNDRERSVFEKSPFPNETFRRFWVAKEAFVKLTGEGLAHPFRDVDVEEDSVNGAYVYRFSLDGHGGAVCARQPLVLSLTVTTSPMALALFSRKGAST